LFVAFDLDQRDVALTLETLFAFGAPPLDRKSTPKPFNRRVGASFIPYSIVGWGFPFLIVLTGQVLDGIVESRGSSSVIQPLFGEGQTCWFNGMKRIRREFPYSVLSFHRGRPSCYLLRLSEWKSLFLYLYGPVAVIVLANLSFFVMTAIQLCKTRKESALALRNQQSQNHITRQRYLVAITWKQCLDIPIHIRATYHL
jgi:hypothetical protein